MANIVEKQLPAYVPFYRDCEHCKKTCKDHEPINFIVSIGSLGKKELLGHHMQCPYGEHWACSPECLEFVAVKCIQEDVIPFLKNVHKEIEQNVSIFNKV
jgi:hypothetical protein